MLEEAKYPSYADHKKSHDLFVKRIGDFRTRFAMGEDVAEELNILVTAWLYYHIRREDADYVTSVKASIPQLDVFVARKKGLFGRLFE